MTERFSDQLRTKADPIWQAQLEHPFVRGLGDGTLDPANFQRWLRQDYLFLLDYARQFALAAARGLDLETMKWMMAMAHGVLNNELLFHQSCAIELGIAEKELAAGVKLPTTRAYTDHLLRTAAVGTYLELTAALLPCVWGYAEIGKRLESSAPAVSRYRRWIEVYSGPAAQDLARNARRLLDSLAKQVSPASLAAAEDSFLVSSRYQWMFWQMCHAGERWPI